MEQSHVVNFYQQMIHISIDRLQLVLEIKLKMRDGTDFKKASHSDFCQGHSDFCQGHSEFCQDHSEFCQGHSEYCQGHI